MKDLIILAKKEFIRQGLKLEQLTTESMISLWDNDTETTVCYSDKDFRSILKIRVYDQVSCAIDKDLHLSIEQHYFSECSASSEKETLKLIKQYIDSRKIYTETIEDCKEILDKANKNIEKTSQYMTDRVLDEYARSLCKEVDNIVRQVFTMNKNLENMTMDDLIDTQLSIDRIDRCARILHAAWYLFLIAVHLLNMYYFLFCDSNKNGIVSIMVFMCICYELIMDKLREIEKTKEKK